VVLLGITWHCIVDSQIFVIQKALYTKLDETTILFKRGSRFQEPLFLI
jgi:hypothetical protein